MTRYFVGPGGNNGNAGTTWALRRLTVTSGFTLLAAGDELRIGPGVYPENPSTGVNGTSGAGVITVVGDEDGQLTDGIGGRIRITGSDNDQTATRATGLTVGNNFWTFRGLHIDTVTADGIDITGNNVIVEQFTVSHFGAIGVSCSGASCNNVTLRHFLVGGSASSNHHIVFTHSAAVSNTAHLVENFILYGGGNSRGINITRVGGITIRDGLVMGYSNTGIRVDTAPAVGQVNNVNQCALIGNAFGMQATATTDITENFNTFFNNNTNRANVNTGANSVAWTPLLAMPLLTLPFHTWMFGTLDPSSPLAALAGTSVPSDDLYQITRLATSSWGPSQFVAAQRPTDSGEPRGRRG